MPQPTNGQIKNLLAKGSALALADKLIGYNDTDTFFATFEDFKDFLTAYFASLNGDATEDFSTNDLTASNFTVSDASGEMVASIYRTFAGDMYSHVSGNFFVVTGIGGDTDNVFTVNGGNGDLQAKGLVTTTGLNVIGTSAGDAAAPLITLKDSDGIELGFVGSPTVSNSDIFVYASLGDILIATPNGQVRLNETTGELSVNKNLTVTEDINTDDTFRKNGTSQTKGVAANVNLTANATTNVQVGNDDNYVYTISSGITPTLNINDASFQLGDTQEFHINGGTGLNITSSGITIYEEANSGTALVGGVVTQYIGNRTSFMIKVKSATEFILY